MKAGNVTESADLAVMIGCAVRVRGIFDDGQIVLACERDKRLHVDGLSIHVNGDDGARARRDFAGNVVHVHVECVGFDIHKDGTGTDVRDGERSCDVGIADGDDLIARSNLSAARARCSASVPLAMPRAY